MQNRVLENILELSSDATVVSNLLLNVVCLLRDESLSWVKFVDEVFTLKPHDLERMFFRRLKFQQEEDVFSWETWENDKFQRQIDLAKMEKKTQSW